MSDNNLSGRRQIQRRQECSLTNDWVYGESHDGPAFLAPPASPIGSPANPGKECRAGHERRHEERRKLKLGPPQGTPERRNCPDLRGVIFPLFYNYN